MFETVKTKEIAKKAQQVTWGTNFETGINSFGFSSQNLFY